MPEISTATGKIRVIKTPGGEPPEAIRAAWVGLTLPCEPIAPLTRTLGVLSHEPTEEGRWVIAVPIEEALEVLAQEHPFAVGWWEEHRISPEVATHFAFDFDEVEIIGGVERQQIIEVTDEMQGYPNR